MADLPPLKLPLGNNWRYELQLVKPDGTLDAGRTDVQFGISETKAGPPIVPALQYPAAETGVGTAVYRVDFPGVDLTAYVTVNREGRIVYIRGTGAGLDSHDKAIVTLGQDASA